MVWNILKYSWRIWLNWMKENDLEKICYYAKMAYDLTKGQLIRIEKGENPRIKVAADRNGLEHHDRLRARKKEERTWLPRVARSTILGMERFFWGLFLHGDNGIRRGGGWTISILHFRKK